MAKSNLVLAKKYGLLAFVGENCWSVDLSHGKSVFRPKAKECQLFTSIPEEIWTTTIRSPDKSHRRVHRYARSDAAESKHSIAELVQPRILEELRIF